MGQDGDTLLDFLEQAGRLKRLRRKGWVDRGVAEPESVADHSYRLALLTLLAGSLHPGIDVSRAVILALVHDLPEVLAGDQTPFDRQLEAGADPAQLFRSYPSYSPEAEAEKSARERAALRQMVAGLPDKLARLLSEAWEEYEAGSTPEARLVRQLDKLETALQATEYRAEQPEITIDSFLLGAEAESVDPLARELLGAILRRAGQVRERMNQD
jgi:putative hydrolase of HD superfamily